MKQSMEILTSMVTNKYGTPRWYISLVHQVFQSRVDLDPATSYEFNARYIRARQFYTAITDGLSQPWIAENVFLNPPYSDENGKRSASTARWIDAAIDKYKNGQFTQGIMLVNFKVGYNWMNDLIDNPIATVFVHRDRIAFTDIYGHLCKPSRQPQATIYVGPNRHRFIRTFSKLGWCINE